MPLIIILKKEGKILNSLSLTKEEWDKLSKEEKTNKLLGV